MQRQAMKITIRSLLAVMAFAFAGWIIVSMTVVQPVGAASASTAPIPISPADKNASAPAITAMGGKSMAVAWEQTDGIWLRRYQAWEWQSPEHISLEGQSLYATYFPRMY